MADLHEAVIEVLKLPQELFELVGLEAAIGDEVERSMRIYGIEVPKADAIKMPRKCIVVRQSGLGGQSGGYARIQRTLIDVSCYGETPLEAETLRLEANRYLKDFRRRMSKGFLLHSFDLVNGPVHQREPLTDWPYTLETWRCLASET